MIISKLPIRTGSIKPNSKAFFADKIDKSLFALTIAALSGLKIFKSINSIFCII